MKTHSRVVFAEGEEEKVVRAAVAFRNAGYGQPILIGREDRVQSTLAGLGLGTSRGSKSTTPGYRAPISKYVEFLYNRLQRQGHLHRDVQRMVNQDRNVFAACMVATGDADAMVTGLTRSASVCLNDIRHAIGPAKNGIAFGLTLLVGMRGKTIFLADSLVQFPSRCGATGRYRDRGRRRRASSRSRAASRFAVPLDVWRSSARPGDPDA